VPTHAETVFLSKQYPLFVIQSNICMIGKIHSNSREFSRKKLKNVIIWLETGYAILDSLFSKRVKCIEV
jgi:hypothetical protein